MPRDVCERGLILVENLGQGTRLERVKWPCCQAVRDREPCSQFKKNHGFIKGGELFFCSIEFRLFWRSMRYGL